MDEIRKKYDDGKLSLGMWDCRFYFVDGDGNQLLDKNGNIRLFTADNHDFSFMADGVEFDELSEVDRNSLLAFWGLQEDLSKAYFDSKDLQETINKTMLTDRHNEVYSFREIFRKHEGTTVEDDLIGDVADDLVETMDRISGRIDEIISIVDDLKDWHGRVDKDQLGQGADIIQDIITSFDLFVNASKEENKNEIS